MTSALSAQREGGAPSLSTGGGTHIGAAIHWNIMFSGAASRGPG